MQKTVRNDVVLVADHPTTHDKSKVKQKTEKEKKRETLEPSTAVDPATKINILCSSSLQSGAVKNAKYQ